MYQDNITFQLATNFLPKTALKLECLYQTINQACEETHPVIHHYALKNVVEIIKLIEKPELKGRFLKELIRIEHGLNKLKADYTSELCERLQTQIRILTHVVGRFGETIHSNPFLQSIKMLQPMQTNDCDLYSPQLLFWLESPAAQRQRDLAVWLNDLRSLHSTVDLYLSLLRETAQFDSVDAFNGFYQRQLPTRNACHLILLRIDKSLGLIPRMQLGHHGFSFRLCDMTTMREIRETEATLELAICQI